MNVGESISLPDFSEEIELRRIKALRELADRLNLSLPDYQCLFVHFGDQDHLLFVPGNEMAAVGKPLEYVIPQAQPVELELDLDQDQEDLD